MGMTPSLSKRKNTFAGLGVAEEAFEDVPFFVKNFGTGPWIFCECFW
jgi:hypothetical protein